MNDLIQDAYAVLLPAFGGLELDDAVLRHLDRGGVSVLLGESRDEYVARAMSDERRANESAAQFNDVVERARRQAGGGVIVAIDQELAGIQRLHRLAPALPGFDTARGLSADDIAQRCAEVARAARGLGVNLFLAPIVDVVSGINPWLERRNLGVDPHEVSRIASAFVRGVQSAGVAATAKHFPGHPVTGLDPALHEAIVSATLDELQPGLGVFREVIGAGVKAVMTGPALVPAFDSEAPSSTSRGTVAFLREHLGFDGLVISDDLDAPGILRGRTVEAVAVASLAAGCDLLLVSSQAGLDTIARTVVEAVERGALAADRLAEAARRVRTLARELEGGHETGVDAGTHVHANRNPGEQSS
ncbi:glycoside hydrolase family 3 protein [Paraburkholderia sp. D15]|uniref:glycoside hydrolase family 3 N-terminal domain-containing protein n=1 Tax=Paraburkholderia sp. D15 TaxID=2880218 RepID=UPI002478C81E|nr:glycoside hydrolase family 3 N-terminal domain-containing protein [Paraburkholderia sp. D15]WGS53855.1 glycoside hydrolase family 3 protein [Paraburkholderia sp. D15]